MADTKQRHRALAVWNLLYQHRDKVHYPPGDQRTEFIHSVSTLDELEALLTRPQGVTVDCSQVVQLVCHVAGWKSPSGTYAIDGSTRTMLAGPCRHYSDARGAGLMAIVVFGPGTGHHTAFVIEPDAQGGNPLLGSHGQESDPRRIRLHDEQAGQPPPTTFLSVVGL
jgi:hypothetical protein